MGGMSATTTRLVLAALFAEKERRKKKTTKREHNKTAQAKWVWEQTTLLWPLREIHPFMLVSLAKNVLLNATSTHLGGKCWRMPSFSQIFRYPEPTQVMWLWSVLTQKACSHQLPKYHSWLTWTGFEVNKNTEKELGNFTPNSPRVATGVSNVNGTKKLTFTNEF